MQWICRSPGLCLFRKQTLIKSSEYKNKTSSWESLWHMMRLQKVTTKTISRTTCWSGILRQSQWTAAHLIVPHRIWEIMSCWYCARREPPGCRKVCNWLSMVFWSPARSISKYTFFLSIEYIEYYDDVNGSGVYGITAIAQAYWKLM